MKRKIVIALPADYRRGDVLAFHSRDKESVAEEVTPERLRKGVLLDGVPTLLDIRFDAERAVCTIDADGAISPLVDDALQNILGLRIDPAPFLKFTKKDPLLGPLARRFKGLRIVQSATIFEALTWAIIGQQINLTFAIALRRTFIEQAGRQHSSDLWCYPEAGDVAGLALDELTTRKFSGAKAETLLRLAGLAARGEITLARDADLADVSKTLLAIKGIGPWTVNYALLRGYGYPDCSLHGDVAIRAALQRLRGEDSKPDMARTEAWLAQYAPHRTMLAAHLWASLAD
ncbi:MAG: DNA-3-methyladenine glycosylase 2 [Pseudomonadota bacterium]